MKTNMIDKTPLTPGICEWCGDICEEEDHCCSLSCEAQLARLEAARGQAVIRVMMSWRAGKLPVDDAKKKKHGYSNAARAAIMATVTPMLDKFLRIDRKRRERLGHERRVKEAEAAAKAAAETPAEPETQRDF